MASRLGLVEVMMGGGGGDIMVLEAAGEKPETRDWGTVATIYSISSCQTAFSFVALLCRLCIYGLESPEQQNAFGLYSIACLKWFPRGDSCPIALMLWCSVERATWNPNLDINGNRCKLTYPSTRHLMLLNAEAITSIPIQLAIFQAKHT
jgi:hypothetical protein